MSESHGYTLLDLLFVVSLVAILTAVAVPQWLLAADRIRAAGATRYLASRMAAARTQAVMRSAAVGLRFDETEEGISFRTFLDANGDGVRTSDIADGTDRPLDPGVTLTALFPGVAIAVSGSAGTDPVRLGATNLLTFTAIGTATSGSVFVRGREGSQFAIRILGATGRVRVQRYVERTRSWADTL